ncbi:MAG: histidine kinase [Spirochaetaceae bacterium]|nr:histidine kinase [Spirochaetaceae bacterium]
MNAVRNLVFGSTLRSLVFRYCMILIVLPIILILLASYFISNNTLRTKIDRNERLVLNQIGINIDYKLNQIHMLASGIMVNKNIIAALREFSYTQYNADVDLIIPATNAIQSYFLSNNACRTIYLRSISGRELSFGIQDNQVSIGMNFGEEAGGEANTDYGHWYYEPRGDIFLTYTTTIKDYYKGNVKLGTLVIHLNRIIFSEVFDQTGFSTGGIYCILGKNNEFIYSDGRVDERYDFSELARPSSFEQYEIKSLHNIPHVVLQRPIAGTDWRLVLATPLRIYLADLHYFRIALVLTGLLSLLLAIGMDFRFSRILGDPINKLAGDMQRLRQGDFSQKGASYRNDELGYIQRRFDEMAVEIRRLIDTVYQKEKAKRTAELIALQAQINPHFLYNTLNSVNCLAQLYHQKDISDMVVNLGILLRNSFESKEELIPISEEVAYLERYLRIANIRWDNSFEMICLIPDEVNQCLIPRLILQPLVENCISHSFADFTGKGRILVTAKDRGDDLAITICDNGKGISPQEMEGINYRLENQKRSNPVHAEQGENSIGIYNVNARIFLRYGEAYGLVFLPNDGPGVSVELSLPKQYKTSEVMLHV